VKVQEGIILSSGADKDKKNQTILIQKSTKPKRWTKEEGTKYIQINEYKLIKWQENVIIHQ
jgi:hypothetical protein